MTAEIEALLVIIALVMAWVALELAALNRQLEPILSGSVARTLATI